MITNPGNPPWIQGSNTLMTNKDWPQPVGLTLDARDPFESVLIEIVKTNRRKRADYARDGDPFSNFTLTADLMGLDGFGAVESSLFNVCQKLARLKALRANGRMNSPQNESVEDTYLDLAVYGIITYAIYKQAVYNYETQEGCEKADGDGRGDHH